MIEDIEVYQRVTQGGLGEVGNEARQASRGHDGLVEN